MEKKYEHISGESTAQQLWENQQTYALENNPGPLYSIDTPPPTVSGNLHIGHIFSYTQTDIIARYKRMSGFSVFYPFGFDDNGLPTERYVEKKCNVRAHEMARSDFIALCTEESRKAADQFKALWQKMGLSADWRETYSTISDTTRKISQESFIKLFKKNYIYRKQEPALYCTTCRTSVAQAELDDALLPSLFIDIIFKDSDGNDLIISTTRPELLPACVALLYHPLDIRYHKLRGKKAIIPLFGNTVPILEDDLVDPTKGSGLVMVCTFGDKNDIVWYKKHNLPYIHVIGLDGKCTDNAGFLKGLKVADARAAVIEKLKEKNLVIAQKEIMHTVNVHERCKKEIEYVILSQWFVSILPYKKIFLEIADTINWYPSFMKSRYVDWVENLSWDWCISRQRFYGIPFPAWHCHNCDATVLADENQLPVDPQETAYSKPCPHCASTNIIPDTDVMDTWNTSSLTPYICHNLYDKNAHVFENNTKPEKNFIPMSMRPQAHDIIRTWAFDTIVKAWMHHGTAPWNKIVISGHVLSDKKQKLSKKEGTAMDPQQLLLKYPADAIRYWTANAKLGQDTMFSEEQLGIGQKLITKLWNAFLFAQPHVENFTSLNKTPHAFGTVNQWLLDTASRCFEQYEKYFTEQEPSLALNCIEKFFWQDYCDNYIELVKNQLFNPHEYTAEEVDATKWTLYHVGLRILQLYAPYIPHVTENIYQQLYRKNVQVDSLHQTHYKKIQILYTFTEATDAIARVITVVATIRKLKSEKQLSLKTPLVTLEIFSPEQSTIDTIAEHEQLLRGVTQAAHILYTNDKGNISYLENKNDAWYAKVII